jgi:uncharacterized membrane protein
MTAKTTAGTTRDSRSEDRAIALVLRIGAYACIVLLVIAGLLGLAGLRVAGIRVAQSGLVVLLGTPITRVLVAGILFLRERDYRYVWVAVGVFAILIATSALAVFKILPALAH